MTEGPGVERQLIAALVQSPGELRRAAPVCGSADFSDARLGMIFDGLLGMQSRGDGIDVSTVADHFPEWGVRGLSATDLYSWGDWVTTPAIAETYAETVRRDSVRRQVAAVVSKVPARLGEAAPDVVLEETVTALQDVRGKSHSERAPLRTMSELLAMEVSYDWLVPGLIERRDRLMLTGAEGYGKSTFMRQLCVGIALGRHPFAQAAMDPARVLVVDAENSDKQWSRNLAGWASNMANQLGGKGSPDNLAIVNSPRLDLRRDSHLSDLHSYVDEFQPDVVCVGPLYRVAGPAGVNDDKDASPILAALDTLRDRGLALLIEAHAGHAQNKAGDRDLRPRGSSALMGWPEFGIGLRPVKDVFWQTELVRWRGDRDARQWPTVLRRGGPGRWPFVPSQRQDVEKEAA